MANQRPYFPGPRNPVTSQIPDSLPNDYQRQVYTPRNTGGIQVPNNFLQPQPNMDEDWYDEPDYTEAVAQGMQDVLAETPRLTRSEAEEQMHLTELRRQAEGYDENDAIVISEVLAKKYPLCMFTALNNEYFNMKNIVDTVTGAVNDGTTA